MQINIDDINVKRRIRKDLGDIPLLANNINEIGLLHPIVINEANELICGSRRLEAFKKLGRKEIPCTKINIPNLIRGEFSENAYRKNLTISEMVEIKRAIEPEIKKEAEIRMKAGKPVPKSGKGRGTEIIAMALGVGHTSLEKAEKLVYTAEKQPENFKKLLDNVDSGKTSLDRAYREVVKSEKVRELLHSPVTSVTDRNVRLIHGDMQVECSQVRNNSIDLIFTDPPYAEKQLDLYRLLFLHAERILKNGGGLVTYIPNYAIPQIIHYYNFTRNLEYYWILAVRHSGPFSSFFAKNILVKWKPLLWFIKYEEGLSKDGVKPKTQNGKIFDLIHSTRPDKVLHDHQQSFDEARYIIEQLTKPGDTIFDPFMGSCSTGISALQLKRRFME